MLTKPDRLAALLLTALLLLPTTVSSAEEYLVRRLRFPRGQNSTIVSGKVAPFKHHEYFFYVRAGQHLTARIKADGANATLYIDPNDGRFSLRDGVAEGRDDGLAEDVTAWSGKFLVGGRHRITISSMDGEAAYKLEVTIK